MMRPLSLLAAATLFVAAFSCNTDDEPAPPPPPPECGNGLLETGEACEGLGDALPMGCDPATCTVDPGWFCLPEPPGADGETGGSSSDDPPEWMSTCELLDTCGDGIIDPEEECDDGDDMVADGCSGCRIDPLWTCVGEPSECFKCGDGFLDPGEECDDGEDIGMNSAGCENCMVVPGWDCFEMPPPSLCGPVCGDGMFFDTTVPGVTIGFAEECDDGNTTPGDGCDAQCHIEDDCECSGSAPGTSTCVCGVGDSTSTGEDTGTDSGSTGGSSGSDSGTGGSSSDGGVMDEGGGGRSRRNTPSPPPVVRSAWTGREPSRS